MIKGIGIIPARFASSRFPGKPLVDIGGKSMIQRVYEQVTRAKMLEKCIVATDDQRIFDHVIHFGGQVEMTDPALPSGTDRVAVVAKKYPNYNLVINIQGDEPFINPAQIDQLCHFMKDNDTFEIGTLALKIDKESDLNNSNVVKVVKDVQHRALYFSRFPIPFQRNAKGNPLDDHDFYQHIGIYAFQQKTLEAIHQLPQSQLEKSESLEQLRWLENGYSIGVAVTNEKTIGIDSPEDLEKVNLLLSRGDL